MSDRPSFPTVPVSSSNADLTGDPGLVHGWTEAAPRRIGAYTLGGVLGSGGMGVVYRAEQTEPLRREVALKVIRRGLDTDRLIARFEAERHVLARMSHSGIARVFDAGATEDGRPYFVMELVAGAPITEFCDAQRASIADRLSVFVAACRAVQHAHQKAIVHRDLKPSNILVTTEEGRPAPKIIDFGIAKALAEDAAADDLVLTREGQYVGTPEYMSPEQAGVVDADVDTRADVYALGVVLYELLAGRKPLHFTTGTRDEVQRVLRGSAPERPSTAVGRTARRGTLAPQAGAAADWQTIVAARRTTPGRLRRLLAGDLDTIVLKAMAFDPARRYATVDRLIDDIERFLAGQPVLARPDGWTYRARKFAARHRIAVTGIAAAIAALLVFSVVTAIQSSRLARERDRAEQARARAEAVNAFLVGMFEQADPKQALGAKLTAVELVERGAAQLGTELRDQPEVRSALLITLSRVHGALGRWERARALAREAVQLRETAGPEPLAEALAQFGDASRQVDGADDAQRALTRALALRRQVHGPMHLQVAQVLQSLAFVRHEQGEYADAESLHRQALHLRRSLAAPRSEDVLNSLAGLAQALRSQSRYGEAEAVYREVLATRRAILPARHPRVIHALRQLAQVLNYQNRNDEAERLFREALSAADAVLGPVHPDTIGVVNDLASLLHDRRKYGEAEGLYERAVRASRAEGNATDLSTQVNNLATLYEDQGRFAEARPLYEESLDLRRRARGARHPAVGTALNNLGRLHATLGNLPQAEHLLREALSIRLESGATHVLTARTKYNLGRIRRMRGAPRDAIVLLDEALAVQHARLAEGHPHALATRLERARARAALRDLAAAEADARFVLRERARARDVQPWEIAEARAVLATTLDQQRRVEARGLLTGARRVLAMAGPAHGLLRADADRAWSHMVGPTDVGRADASARLDRSPR
jgi:serine/threonine protein kinase/tetratricopeptide (TPR) repeat protein